MPNAQVHINVLEKNYPNLRKEKKIAKDYNTKNAKYIKRQDLTFLWFLFRNKISKNNQKFKKHQRKKLIKVIIVSTLSRQKI